MSQATVAPARPAPPGGPELSRAQVNVVFAVPAREADVEAGLGVPPGVLRPFYDEIVTAGYLRRDGDVLTLTGSGRAETAKITAAWRLADGRAERPADGA